MSSSPTPTPDDSARIELTLDGFTDWLLELHGNTFDAMDTATGDAYRELLGDFGRTNAALNLLVQFKAEHATGQQPDALALVNGGAA